MQWIGSLANLVMIYSETIVVTKLQQQSELPSEQLETVFLCKSWCRILLKRAKKPIWLLGCMTDGSSNRQGIVHPRHAPPWSSTADWQRIRLPVRSVDCDLLGKYRRFQRRDARHHDGMSFHRKSPKNGWRWKCCPSSRWTNLAEKRRDHSCWSLPLTHKAFHWNRCIENNFEQVKQSSGMSSAPSLRRHQGWLCILRCSSSQRRGG